MTWWVYVVECADRTLYTGIARDLDTRLDRHNEGRGAKYTRSRRPVKLVYREPVADRSQALRREYVIRRLPRARKKLLMRPGSTPDAADTPHELAI